MKPIIPITFSVDDNYVKHAAVVIKSILSNSSKEYHYEFIIFDNGILDKTKKLLQKSLKNYQNASVRFLDLRVKTSKFLTTNIQSAAIFDRLFIPEVLKKYDKVIQMDADMVVLDDISKLYNEDISGVYVGCVLDRFIQQHIKDKDSVWLRDVPQLQKYNWKTYIKNYLKLNKPTEYFNAGMMLMNLKLMRKDKISKKLIDYLQKHQPLALCDQDALNAVIQDKKKILSPHWNFVIDFSIIYPDDIYSKTKNEPLGIIHRKLWDNNYLLGYSDYYYQYLPKEFSNIQYRVPKEIKEEDITFVCTGKIFTKGIFTTKKSLQSVRKYFPKSKIILSTWEGEDLSSVQGLYNEIVVNPLMRPTYWAHLESCPWKALNTYDLQQYSVHKGLKACKTKYAVRFRTDFILRNRNFFKEYLRFNKIFNKYEADCQIFEERVLIHETLTINPHIGDLGFTQHPADVFHFGLTSDLLKLWDGGVMPRSVYNYFNEGHQEPNPCFFASQYIIEQYLWVALLERCGKTAGVPDYYLAKNSELIELTDRFFISNFIILDEKLLGISSKFDKIQYSQKYRFFSLRHFCERYLNFIDKCSENVKNIIKLCDDIEKSRNDMITFLIPFQKIYNMITNSVCFHKIKQIFQWLILPLLSLIYLIKYYKILYKRLK